MPYNAKELLGSDELLPNVRGIRIATKTMASMCPLADIVSQSGIRNALPQLNLQIDPSLGQDYQNVVRGGDGNNINVLDFYAPRGSFGVASSSPDGIVYFRLDTLMTDNFGRNTPILIGLKGVSIKDRELLWQTVFMLFPNVAFKVSEKRLSTAEQQQLAKQNVVPIALFDLSQNLPRVKDSVVSQTVPVLKASEANRQEQGRKPTQPEPEARLSRDQKDQVRDYLAEYKAAMYGNQKFAIMEELSKILPDFNGIQNEVGNRMVLSGDSKAHVWTLSEIEEYIKMK